MRRERPEHGELGEAEGGCLGGPKAPEIGLCSCPCCELIQKLLKLDRGTSCCKLILDEMLGLGALNP